MAGFTTTEEKAILDDRFPTTGATDYIGWSADGSTETEAVARTSIGATGWAAATGGGPSTKSNANDLTSAEASAAVTLSDWAVFSASTGGTQRTDWTALDASQELAIGDKASVAAGALAITLD